MRAGITRSIGLLLCVLAFISQAQSQHIETTIQLPQQQMSAAAVLEHIEKKLSVQFTYASAVHEQLQRKISFPSSILTVKQILETVRKQTGITHRLAGKDAITLHYQAPEKSEQKTPASTAVPGKVSGKITDEDDGLSVIGATIQIAGKSAITNIDGSFSIALPAGVYQANISYIGYGTKEITDVQVEAGKVFDMQVTLKRQKGQLSSVVVKASARRETTASLYQRQKNSSSISDGISAEQISRTPDKNIGEVLKRISGLATVDNRYVVVRGMSERYNGALLNGQLMPSTELNRKNFSYDIIPSNLIENVVVMKTITPDMPAEFGGGLVVVNTRDLPAEDYFNVSAGGSWNERTTGKSFLTYPLDNKAYLGGIPDNRKLFGKTNWTSRKSIIDYYENQKSNPALFTNNWGLKEMNAPLSSNFQLSGGKVFSLDENRKIGITLSASYRNTFANQDIYMTRDGYSQGYNEQHYLEKFGFRGTRYSFNVNTGAIAAIGYSGSKSKFSWNNILLRSFDQNLNWGRGHHDDYNWLQALYDVTTQSTIWQSQLKGENELTRKGLKLKWMGSFLDLNKSKPDNHILKGYAAFGPDSTIYPFNLRHGGPGVGSDGGQERTWSATREKNFSWDISLSQPWVTSLFKKTFTNTFKIGYAGWSKDRTFFVARSGSKAPSLDYPHINEAFSKDRLTEIYFNRFGDDLDKKAMLQAGFAMLDQKFGKFRLVWGLRGEYYNINSVNKALQGEMTNPFDNELYPYDYSQLLDIEKNMNWFPSASLTYALSKKINLRLAYSKSIIRPDLRELSWFREYDFELGGEYSSRTMILSTHIKNYDFRFEWYPSANEVLSLSAFCKELKHPMEIYKQGDNREYTLQNNHSALNYGIEMEIRKSFAFTKLPVLKNITLYTNLTAMDAYVYRGGVSTTVIDRVVIPQDIKNQKEHRTQTGQSNYMINAGLYYDTKLISTSLSYNYVTNRMFRPDLLYRNALYERPLQSLDAQLAIFLFKRKGAVRLNISNLLQSSNLVYLNMDNDWKENYEPSTRELLFQNGKDKKDFESKPGRTISFTFSYQF